MVTIADEIKVNFEESKLCNYNNKVIIMITNFMYLYRFWKHKISKFTEEISSGFVWWGPAVSASWNDPGIALDVSFNARQGLQTSNLDNDWKLETVLQKWHSNQASEVTWETIPKVLIECEQCNIAREEQEYLEEPEVYKTYILKKDFILFAE